MTASTMEILDDAFYAAMFWVWQAEGPAIIERVRLEHPAAYLKLIASIVRRPSLGLDAEVTALCCDDDLEALRAFLAGASHPESNGD
jgi:hypothetical protein